jgi:hypothetical protein
MVICPPPRESMVGAIGHPFMVSDVPPKPEGEIQSVHERALELVEVMQRVVRDWRPDVIFREPWYYESAEVALRLGIPDAQVAIGLAGYLWDRIERDSPWLDAVRTGLADEFRCSPFLTRLPACLDASPFPDTWRYREPAAGPGGALPPWWPNSGAPLVYVSLGTVVGGKPASVELYRAVINSVAGLDARVLVTVGRDFDLSRLEGVPANVRVEPWVDQDNVLAEARLMVCHGGSGSVYGSLAAGVPVVIIPLFADHFANAAAVATAGAGLRIPRGQDAAERPNRIWLEDIPRLRQAIQAGLGEAIEAVLSDGSYRQAAQAVAAEMAAAPTIGELLDRLPHRQASRSRTVTDSSGLPSS